jgi:hypothetical protein
MNAVKWRAGLAAAIVVVALALLFQRQRRREIRLQTLQLESEGLRAQRQQLGPQTAIDIAAVRPTGFYRAEMHPAAGLRPMVLALSGPEAKTETLYVALLPDLVAGDFTSVERVPRGVVVRLRAAAQAWVSVLSRDRTRGGRVVREAIVVDGKIVSAPAVREEIRVNSLQIAGLGMDQAAWVETLRQEVAAANPAAAPAPR